MLRAAPPPPILLGGWGRRRSDRWGRSHAFTIVSWSIGVGVPGLLARRAGAASGSRGPHKRLLGRHASIELRRSQRLRLKRSESYKLFARDIAIAGIEATWDPWATERGSRGSTFLNGAPLQTNASCRHDGVHASEPLVALVADLARGACFVLVIRGATGTTVGHEGERLRCMAMSISQRQFGVEVLPVKLRVCDARLLDPSRRARLHPRRHEAGDRGRTVCVLRRLRA